MRNGFLCVATLGAAIFFAGTALAVVPEYSFEDILSAGGPPGPDGFFGLGAGVVQEPVIGVTHLENSMKFIAGGGGFVGVRTESVPSTINNPPGVEYVLFDINIPEIPVGLTFADIGVTVFGHDIDNGIFGIQNQFTDTVSIAALGVGQHFDRRIDLDSEFFSGQSFNDIFGDDVADLDIASAFQFYMSKTAGISLTVYIDNVRVVVPEPASMSLVGLGLAAVGLCVRRRSA
jgi:hypothetical protein